MCVGVLFMIIRMNNIQKTRVRTHLYSRPTHTICMNEKIIWKRKKERLVLLTELPMLTMASRARRTRVGFVDTANARATCEQNSTEIPTVMTRLTNESALSGMDQKNMRANMLAMIIAIVQTMIADVQTSKPRRNIVMTKIAARLTERLNTVFLTMVRYCS